MRALSVRYPWVGLITAGKKTIETRTWKTDYRGDLLICATASPSGPDAGHALCIVTLIDVRPMTDEDVVAAYVPVFPGAWAWILENLRLIEPFPVSGQQGFYDVALPRSARLKSSDSPRNTRRI